MIDDPQQVIKLVERYLQLHQPSDYKLSVLREGVRQDGDWWYVIVQPSSDRPRSYDYYDALSETEQDIQDKEQENILLVPVMPNYA